MLSIKQIYDSSIPLLYHICKANGLSREDAVSAITDTYVYLIRKDALTNKLMHECKKLLCTILLKKIVTHYNHKAKRAKARAPVLVGNMEVFEQAVEYTDDDKKNYIAQMIEAIQMLPRQQKNIIQRILDGCSVSEVSVKMGLTTRTVKNQKAIAIKKIREYCGQKGGKIVLFR